MVKIKERREAMGISQKELAADAGITQPAMSMIESGDRTPSVEVLIKIAIRLDCLIDELIDRSDIET